MDQLNLGSKPPAHPAARSVALAGAVASRSAVWDQKLLQERLQAVASPSNAPPSGQPPAESSTTASSASKKQKKEAERSSSPEDADNRSLARSESFADFLAQAERLAERDLAASGSQRFGEEGVLEEVLRSGDGTLQRYSVSSLWGLLQNRVDQHQQDEILEDTQKLELLKKAISAESKKNFAFEREIRTLDQKIALLIRNRITIEEVMASHQSSGYLSRRTTMKDEQQRKQYSNLFYLLQSEPRYLATLCPMVKLFEVDQILQTLMFTLFGNQYDPREEHLLLTLFGLVIDHDVQTSSAIGSLLRGTTALTRMMTTYIRRGPGQMYLKKTLAPLLKEVVSQASLNLEINPAKVYEEMLSEHEALTGEISDKKHGVSNEVAGADPDVLAAIAPRLEKLKELTRGFLDVICTSTDELPYGVRWICKRIRETAENRFPDASPNQLRSLVGGFILLRFINPAIVTPDAMMLVASKPAGNVRRAVTLVAKVMQNLSNNVMFSGQKEVYMSPLNDFLLEHKESLFKFFDDVVDVKEPSVAFEIDKYATVLQSANLQISISLNEVYFLHGLLASHLEDLGLDDDDPLREVIRELGEPHSILPRSVNASIDLPLMNRFADEADETEGKKDDGAQSEKSTMELYAETKHSLCTVFRKQPALQKNDSGQNLLSALTEARQTASPEVSSLVWDLMQNIAKLTALGVLSEQDNFARLRKDVAEGLINFDAGREKRRRDIETLALTLADIVKQNRLLQAKFSTYDQYLKNVREKALVAERRGSKSSGRRGSQPKQTKLRTSSKAGSSGNLSPLAQEAKPRVPGAAGEIRISHEHLEKVGVLISSPIPPDRRQYVTFAVKESSDAPGTFTLSMFAKGKAEPIFSVPLAFEELLARQEEFQRLKATTKDMEGADAVSGVATIELGRGLKCNVETLIILLRESFDSDNADALDDSAGLPLTRDAGEGAVVAQTAASVAVAAAEPQLF